MAPSRACECWTSTSQQPSHATAAQAQACSHLPSPDRDPSGISRVRPHDRDAVRRCADGHDTSVGEGQAPARRRRDGRSLGSGTWRAGWGVVGAGHPAAGQREPQRHPAASALKALQTLGQVWPDRAGAAEVMARPGAVGAARRWGWSWHRSSRTAVGEAILKWTLCEPSGKWPS